MSNRPGFRYRVLLALCLLGPASAACAADDSPGLFESEETLVVTFTAPWRELVRNRRAEDAYPATIEYTGASGETVSVELTVERRGVSRQKVCRFPPVKLRFQEDAAKDTLFRGQKNLKMVTHCQERSNYEQHYVLEMLAYRIFNQLTERSFRVRPLLVTYEEPGRRVDDDPTFGFLIEDDKRLAERLDLEKVDVPSIGPGRLDAGEAALMALFQYLIANSDWAALRGPEPEECCHNIKLMGPKSPEAGGRLFAIPYDFDAAGLVNTDYAAPASGLPIRTVTQRLYRGYCVHNQALGEARRQVLAREQAIYDLVTAEESLQSRRRDRANSFLEQGFEILRDDKDFQRRIVDRCRG